jgi:two-component system, cell cycle sensor histidine kinase PleC
MARANAASELLRARSVLGVARSKHHPIQEKLQRYEQHLRLAVPIMAAVFALLLGISGTLYVSATHEDRFEDAIHDMDIIAALAARDITAQIGRFASDPGRTLISEHVHHRAFRGGRSLVITAADGRIIASHPPVPPHAVTLNDVLGQAQALTTFAERAGVLKIETPSGPMFATVRTLPGPLGQLAVLQPYSAAMQEAAVRGRVITVLLAGAIAVLALLTLAFLLQTGRAHAADIDCERVGERVEAALDGGRCGLWDWDVARGVIYWSKSMYTLLGHERRGEFISFGEVNAMIHPDDADLYDLAQRLSTDATGQIARDIRLRTADGGWMWLRTRAELMTDRKTGERHLVGIAVDITEERRIAQASANADARVRDAVETISEAFVLWDERNRLVTCNSKYLALHGLTEQQAQPGAAYKDVEAMMTPPMIAEDILQEDNPITRSRLSEVKLADGRWLQISERRTRDGGLVSVGTDITMIKEHEHRLMDSERALIATVADLKSSRRQLEAQTQKLAEIAEQYLEQKMMADAASEAKTRFLANMSHDLRTPLNAIIGFSGIMESGLFGALGCERHLTYCRDIRESGEHLLGILDDILDMSRLECGSVSVKPETLPLMPALMAAHEAMRPQFEAKKIAVAIAVDDHQIVLADRKAFGQVMFNLLQNAAKFTASGGSVSVRVCAGGGSLRIFVADDGCGIPAAQVARLARPFEQLEGGETARTHKGSGLGLAITRALLELHGGGLKLRSREGVGTIAMARFPAAPKH